MSTLTHRLDELGRQKEVTARQVNELIDLFERSLEHLKTTSDPEEVWITQSVTTLNRLSHEVSAMRTENVGHELDDKLDTAERRTLRAHALNFSQIIRSSSGPS
jgi:hypothetical protein